MSHSIHDPIIADVAALLKDAQSVLFITGAGISADSDLPTYRGVGGLYDGNDTEEGIAIEDALSGSMFSRRPDLTWKYLWEIGSACVGALPNAAHNIIAEIELEKQDVWVLTQNIDGLHRAAGTQNLIEVHGHMYELYCTHCQYEYAAQVLLSDFRVQTTLPPKCQHCNGIIRPKVVLFGEFLADDTLHAMNKILSRDFDMVFSIGTSAVFPYIQQPLLQATKANKTTIEINPVRTEVSSLCQYRLPMGAAIAMQQLRAGLD